MGYFGNVIPVNSLDSNVEKKKHGTVNKPRTLTIDKDF